MATTATVLTERNDYFAWISQFLKGELKPYPGRAVAASRIVVAATLTMIVIMTFRIEGGALGTLYAFFISRDTLRATMRSAVSILASYTIGIGFVLLGATFFADEPTLRFLWFSGSIFVVFFFIKILDNFEAATAFALLVVNTLPIWQLLRPAESRVESTLGQALGVGIGTLVTVGVEMIFHTLHPKEELFEGLAERWDALRQLLRCYAQEIPVPETLVGQFADSSMLGSSRLRRIAATSNYERQYREQLTAVVALTGRLMEIGSTMAYMPYNLAEGDQDRIAHVLAQLDEIEKAVNAKTVPPVREMDALTISGIPLLPEIIRTVNLIPQVFSGQDSSGADIPPSLSLGSVSSIFVRDAFSNLEYVKFAARGCLVATLCYFTYTVLDWRGLSTSIAACTLTALSSIGASRQRQILRLTGGAAGGFIFGMGSQAFILPRLDSISQFVLLFAAVTGIAAWIATSSPRLSYFGVQMAQAFYFVHVQEFAIQTSLNVARDRVLGILFGLIVMWIVFDKIWSKPAAHEMIEVFISNLRLIANLARNLPEGKPDADLKRIRLLRYQIASNFTKVNTEADAIPFEFGQKRARHMAARAFIKRWQPSIRTLYLMELTLLQYRFFGSDAELPASIVAAQRRFNNTCAQALETMAARLEGTNTVSPGEEVADSLHTLEERFASVSPVLLRGSFVRVHGLVALSQQIGSLLEETFLDIARSPRIGMSSLKH